MANAKSLRKRIALVAAAAVGVGMLVAAPASALVTTAAVVTAGSTTLYTVPGVAATTAVSLATTTAETAAGAITITPSITSQTATGTALTVGPVGSGTVGLGTPVVTGNFAAGATANAWTNTVAGGVESLTWSSGTIPAFTATAVSTFSLTAVRPGTYVIALTPAGAATTNTPVTITVVVQALAYTTGDGTPASPWTTGNGIAGPANTVTVTGVTNGVASVRSLVTVSGAGATITSGTSSPVIATGGASATILATATSALTIATPTAGTVTLNLYNETAASSGIFNATADGTVTITVTAAAVSGTPVVAKSTAFLGLAGATATVDATVSAAATANTTTPAANVTVVQLDSLGGAATGKLTVSITGPGTLGVGTAATSGAAPSTGKSFTGTATPSAQFVTIYADGISGVATVTVSLGSAVLATKTVTFTGSAATYAVTQGFSAFRVGSNGADGSSGSYGVAVKVTDSSGNIVANGTTVYATSGTTANATITASQTTTSGYVYFNVQGVAEGTSVLTFGNASSAPTVTATTTVNVTASVAATVTLAFDKATYAPGDKVVLMLTAKDAAGQPISDVAATTATYASFFAADLVSTTSLSGASLTGSGTPVFVNGVKTWTLYAPLTAGPFSVNGTTGTATGLATAAQSVAKSASANVVAAPNADVAAAKAAADAAVVAANAATAAVATLSTTVASLIASITAQLKALSALVKKIMKKFKIK